MVHKREDNVRRFHYRHKKQYMDPTSFWHSTYLDDISWLVFGRLVWFHLYRPSLRLQESDNSPCTQFCRVWTWRGLWLYTISTEALSSSSFSWYLTWHDDEVAVPMGVPLSPSFAGSKTHLFCPGKAKPVIMLWKLLWKEALLQVHHKPMRMKCIGVSTGPRRCNADQF